MELSDAHTPVAAPPDELAELVRGALLHLYDLTYLQTHPLLALVDTPRTALSARATALRQVLLDAISSLHPGHGTPTTSRAWRTYRLLELRYVEGLDVVAVVEQLAIGKSHYHREHQRALQAVAAVVWERSGLRGRWPAAPASPPGETQLDQEAERLTRREAELLLPTGGAVLVDVLDVLDGVRQLLIPLCEQRGVHLSIQAPATLPPIPGERIALRQAFLAVLAHAIDAAQDRTVEVIARRDPHHVDVDIGAPNTRRSASWQLALHESRPFVETLKGRVHDLDDGTAAGWSIRVSLPIDVNPTLLVVDNNADFIRLVERYLFHHDWQVMGCGDVVQAMAIVQEQPPRAILLDVVLPEHDGWELLEQIKRLPTTRRIPVIICSVLSEPSVALALGATSYLHKPIDEAQLVGALGPLR